MMYVGRRMSISCLHFLVLSGSFLRWHLHDIWSICHRKCESWNCVKYWTSDLENRIRHRLRSVPPYYVNALPYVNLVFPLRNFTKYVEAELGSWSRATLEFDCWARRRWLRIASRVENMTSYEDLAFSWEVVDRLTIFCWEDGDFAGTPQKLRSTVSTHLSLL